MIPSKYLVAELVRIVAGSSNRKARGREESFDGVHEDYALATKLGTDAGVTEVSYGVFQDICER